MKLKFEVHFCEGMKSSSDDLVPLEAIIDEEVCESVVEVRPQPHQPVSFIRVTDLSKENICFLQSSAEHHGLLIMNIVIRSSMNHQVFLICQLLCSGGHVTGLVARQIILGCGQTKVSLNRIIINSNLDPLPLLTTTNSYV